MKSAPAIAFDYRPSYWLAAAIGVIATLALVAVALSGIDPWLKLALAGTASIYAARALWRFLGSPVRRMAWHEAGHWRTADSDGHERVAELKHAVVRGGWIALALQLGDGKCIALILAPDNCAADVRRRLRVRLARVHDVTLSKP